MAKKHKTRQEKIIADLRRKLQVQQVPPAKLNEGYSLTKSKPILTLPTTTKNYTLKTTNYSYVLSDLKKTALLTIIALAAQAILYFVLVK